MKYPKHVKIVEVGPRDGLQNINEIVPLEVKIEWINKLATTGIKTIEAAAFVSPKWVPQMAQSSDIFKLIQRHEGVTYSAIVPNHQGLEQAIACQVAEIGLLCAVSESFCQKNVNASIEQVLERNKDLTRLAHAQGIRVRCYVSCVLGCPYEGNIAPEVVIEVVKKVYDSGCDEIVLGDTIGTGTAGSTEQLLHLVKQHIPVDCLAVHFHDTYGQALANILIALQEGITTIDTAVAGLGGCPYAVGATGNVSTEDVVYMLNGLNIDTGINLPKLVDVSKYICEAIQCPNQSKVVRAFSP